MLNPLQTPEYKSLQNELQKMTMKWAQTGTCDQEKLRSYRHRLLEANHQHYYTNIPRYRRLCEKSGVGEQASLQTITQKLMVTDDTFKSYPQRLLEARDFQGMTEWVKQVSTFRGTLNSQDIHSIDDWLSELERQGLYLVFSSGTSGQMSFVPRDQQSWSHFMNLPYLYLPQFLGRRGVLPWWKRSALKLISTRLSPQKFLNLIKKIGMRDLEGFFMNFAGGQQGIQLVGQEAGKLTRTAHYLYEIKMSATAVRSLVRGPKNADDEKAVEQFLLTTVHRKEENYSRMIQQMQTCADDGRKVMLFGTPYLLKELCEKVWLDRGQLCLPSGSHVMYGGGWKSFNGQRIPEDQLLSMISHTFGLPKEAILEGYSMTEINGLLPKCQEGRFHLPPYLEALTLDEELNVQSQNQSVGTLAILDPFAVSYPGFLITGDNVSLSHTSCPCGLDGSSILQVERAPGREVKGCGGIMATVNA